MEQQRKFRIRLRTRIILVYLMCAIGAAIAPVEAFVRTGHIERPLWVISLLAFLTGVLVATTVMYVHWRRGQIQR